jgi:hypothetical protein
MKLSGDEPASGDTVTAAWKKACDFEAGEEAAGVGPPRAGGFAGDFAGDFDGDGGSAAARAGRAVVPAAGAA